MKSSTRGHTLIEVTISATVLIAGMALVAQTVDRSFGSAHVTSATNEAAHAARAALQLLGRELSDTGQDDIEDHLISHPRDLGGEAPGVLFQRRVALTGEASDWSTPIEYRLVDTTGELSGNGVDDDGDGLIDEQALVRIQDGRATVIDHGVLALRFLRVPEDEFITVSITIGRGALVGQEHKPITRALTTGFKIRNTH